MRRGARRSRHHTLPWLTDLVAPNRRFHRRVLIPDIPSLACIMRLLVRRGIFAAHQPSRDPLHGPTNSSRWLVEESETNLAPLVIMQNHPDLLAPCHYIGQCIRDGGMPFKKAYGMEVFEMASKNPQFNKLFNDAMACTNRIILLAIVAAYQDGFRSIGSFMDVGGGIGKVIAEIVNANPNIRGINFDLAMSWPLPLHIPALST
ncbi:hypothetical protein CDL15_Pgr023340 [Punica granatum]|uniref:O-methyltransferase C-terminal domain-containing protein n=1 Tax=Punica granatum TaxID=22663 RepID=A0A218Y118_PUNGR|nr:hypothetical protein CDL15_Pgr023340 [Punica granatum]